MKVADAIGAQLDWMVAKCEGYIGDRNSWLHEATLEEVEDGSFHPSSNWAHGGPIIEREGISTSPVNGWSSGLTDRAHGIYWTSGPESPTPLVAAMRCYVASKLGDEVEVPEELL